MSQATLTRRGFLKSSAAMGAVAALGISAADSLTAVDPAHADEAGEVKIRPRVAPALPAAPCSPTCVTAVW